MSTVEAAIHEYFKNTQDHKTAIEDIEDTLSISTVRSYLRFLFHSGIVIFPVWLNHQFHFHAPGQKIGGDIIAVGALYFFFYASLEGTLLDAEWRPQEGRLRTIFDSIHKLVFFRPPDEYPELDDRDITYFWLYKLWDADANEVDEFAERFLDFVDGEYPRGPVELHKSEIEVFVEKLRENPDYRAQTVDNYAETILKHIIEFEKGTHLYGVRGEFVDYDTDKQYLSQVVDELNQSYQYGLDGAVFMLGRKFTENLLAEFYLKHFPERKAHYDVNKNRSKTLGALKSELASDVDEFHSYTPLINQSLIDKLERIQNRGNAHVHNSEVIYREQDLQQLREDIEDVVEAVTTLDNKLSK